jgi:DNA (cytosine-5)-methyltransferase 1
VWASEIDEFPAAVTAHHFPEVKQLGDITKIDPDKLEPVDIICAGSPCQDLSVAGKRAGLEGERSGLFRTAIRLVHELRRRTGKPRYFVWENVPGAFSSNKGLDFRAVLEEIAETEIPMPKDNKWAPAGVVEWDGGSLAWRTLDAQYWGVPQRRKRIFLVADFGGLTAGEILFERKSLYGHTAESEGEGQGTATNAGAGVESTGWVATLTMRSGKPGGGKGPLVKEELSLALSTQNTQTVFTGGFKYRNGAKARSIGYADEQSPTLETSQNAAIYNTPIVQCLNDQGGSVMDVSDKAATLRAESHGHVPIVKAYAFDSLASNAMQSSNPHSGGREVEVSKCLDTTTPDPSKNQGGVAIVGYRASGFQSYSEDKVAGTLRAEGGTAGGGSETFVISEKSDA